ncbi:MAG: EamA family transporter [Chloroflexi bacterium]|nr:EamA family transporter [Chloroflexota bacterium]
MVALAVFLALLAALTHATWNLLVKTGGDRVALLWWSFLASSLFYAPTLALLPRPFPAPLLPILVLSGLAQCGYAIFLARAYARGPFSRVYPVARGTGPVLIALWAWLFLGERPSLAGWLGLTLILAAIGLIALPGLRDGQLPRVPFGAALGVGFFISLYSTVDKIGVQFISAPVYLTLEYLALTLLLAPYAWIARGPTVMAEQLRRHWRPVAAVGLLSGLTYYLVLSAMSLGPLTYVGTARETSVVFATILGRVVLGERVKPLHVGAVGLLVAGVVVLAVGG